MHFWVVPANAIFSYLVLTLPSSKQSMIYSCSVSMSLVLSQVGKEQDNED
uniref:Uncharacterized protein n=1 Tax=Lotus japonicus TaxID=34305 RepID=I3SPP1_LOTJA|nr:unknown [Lotus japonicus]